MDRLARPEALGTAAQDRGITGLEAERAGIGGDIRPALVNHGDNAERDAYARNAHAVRPPPRFHDGADRIFELADHVEARRHRFDALGIKRQPVEEGRAGATRLRFGAILRIGGEDRGARAPDRLGHRRKRPILLRGWRKRQSARGRARGAADLAHGRGERAGAGNGFQRGIHLSLMALIRLAFGNFLSRSAKPGEATGRNPVRRRYPQQSTAFAAPSHISGNLPDNSHVRNFGSANERVSCICQQVLSRAVCPGGFLSVPPMWSRAAAAPRGNCAYFRAMWSCPTAGASTLLTILAVRPWRGPAGAPAARAKIRPKTAAKPAPPGAKKLWLRVERRANTVVDGQTPGEAPQPLTLNHPASNPGCFLRPG